jgi:diguanylate cyclase (GGDEF)-like protein
LLADLDGLKQLNDEQGHAAGDRAIRSVAAAITGTLRETDFAARWGGDEFAIAAPNTTAAAAVRSAERLITQVRDTPTTGATPVTVSIGIATFDPWQHAATEIEPLIGAADAALYMAKAAGGGRARLAERMARVPRRPARY